MTIAEQLHQETEQFSKFVARLIAREPDLTVTFDEAVRLFHEYEARMDRLREELRPAYEASLRGETTPWNADEIWKAVEAELIRKGIPE